MDIYRRLIKQITRTYASNKNLKQYLIAVFKNNIK
jgi:hypothetical protein